jgi:UPF0716 protein FxsA
MERLFLLFTIVPLLDLLLLLRIGEVLGTGPTIGLVIATAIVGAALAKSEGLRVLRQWQRAIAEGRIPEEGVLSGVLVLVGGVLLVTPGVVTDAVGLALLFPPTRRVVAEQVRRWTARQIRRGTVHVVQWGDFRRREPRDVTPPRSEDRFEERRELPPEE